MKQKQGSITTRTKGMYLQEIDVTQFAMEALQKRLGKLEKAHNPNGVELKQVQIQLNMQDVTIKRLQERIQRRDSE